MKTRRSLGPVSLFAWALGLAVGAFAYFSGNSAGFPPELFADLAVGADLRPPVHEFPALWLQGVSRVLARVDLATVRRVLSALGPVALGVLAAMVLRLFAGYLRALSGVRSCRRPCERWIVSLVLLQGTLVFVCSPPVWQMGRALSPDLFLLLLTVAILLFLQRAVEKSSLFFALLASAVCGIVAAETPLGFLPLPLFLLYLRFADHDAAGFIPTLANPVVVKALMRRTIWTFVVFWIVGVSFNLAFYRSRGGGGIADSGLFIAVLRYLMCYVRTVRHLFSPLGGLLAAVTVLFPVLISLALVRRSTETDRLLPVPHACFFLVAGTLAFLQSTGFSDCHFWTWTPQAVRSPYLLGLCLLATALTVLLSLEVFAVEFHFRNNARLLRLQFPPVLATEPLAVRALRLIKRTVRLLRPATWLEPALALALVLPFCVNPLMREMTAIVNALVYQTADECAGTPILFSDGAFDAAVEVAAAERGARLLVHSLMSGSSRYETAVRTRGVTDPARRRVLAMGAADALRAWVQEKDPVVSNIAVQVGHELWRMSKTPPAVGGLVARTAGFAPGEADKRARAAHALAFRLLRLYTSGADPASVGLPELSRLIVFGQWRLSRLCRLRAIDASRRGDVDLAEAEHELADKLDACNPSWLEVQEKTEWVRKKGGLAPTPREGLLHSLKRADFVAARACAQAVLATDAGDLQANFALGMGAYLEGRYARAESHLQKCLLRAPDEPAVLNNLAVVQLRLGRLDAAETNALRALRRLPDSSEIQTTLRHVRAAMAERKKRPASAGGPM
jgi:tetratricopeptide (TPR) repeat protein